MPKKTRSSLFLRLPYSCTLAATHLRDGAALSAGLNHHPPRQGVPSPNRVFGRTKAQVPKTMGEMSMIAQRRR